MTLNIAVCDDEEKSVFEIKKLIDEYFSEKNTDINVLMYFDSKTLLNSEYIFDIFFTDIEIDEKNGIELSEYVLNKNKKCLIFMITNYSCYIDSAFDVKAFRFFSKPIEKHRFFSGLDKALKNINFDNQKLILTNIENKSKYSIVLSSIIYIENKDRHTHIVTTVDDIVVKETFSMVKSEIELKTNDFVHSHNSYFINMNFIKYYDKNRVGLGHEDKYYSVHMSRRKYNDFEKQFISFARDLK